MYITKRIGNFNITFKAHLSLGSFTLINASVDRFYGYLARFTICNVGISIGYVSERQDKAFEDLIKHINDIPEDGV